MKKYIIIRGPAGVGKSTIAKKLSKKINSYYISYDDIMKKNGLDIIEDDAISPENFIKANNIILQIIKEKDSVIFDGCFYRKEQIEHLLKELNGEVYIFTLMADLKECLSRNMKRKDPMKKKSIVEVYNLVKSLDEGTFIQTDKKTTDEVIEKIISKI
jgi:shikimate kinase